MCHRTDIIVCTMCLFPKCQVLNLLIRNRLHHLPNVFAPNMPGVVDAELEDGLSLVVQAITNVRQCYIPVVSYAVMLVSCL